MPTDHVVLEVQVERTPRVLRVESMFDVPASEKSRLELDIGMPIEDRPWSVGLIVGPSGAGKSTVGARIFQRPVSLEWSGSKALVDSFDQRFTIQDIAEALASVGLSSIPSWLRPFRVLSTGEQFRAMMARTILETDGLVVVDEFTSVVDRQVAQVASHAVQKYVRKTGRQFVAIGCHYDVIDWLQPDWIYEPHVNRFNWRSLQRHPELQLEIHKVHGSDYWPLFGRYHYMSGELHKAARCFVLTLDGQPVAFNAYMHQAHAQTKNIKFGHRLVVLPDYQGLGIGPRFDEWLGEYLYARGFRYHNHTANPAMIRYYSKSVRWRALNQTLGITGTSANKSLKIKAKLIRRLSLRSFAYSPKVTQ
jgi:GNAT superfamily N-acetyltransferase